MAISDEQPVNVGNLKAVVAAIEEKNAPASLVVECDRVSGTYQVLSSINFSNVNVSQISTSDVQEGYRVIATCDKTGTYSVGADLMLKTLGGNPVYKSTLTVNIGGATHTDTNNASVDTEVALSYEKTIAISAGTRVQISGTGRGYNAILGTNKLDVSIVRL